MYVYQAVPIGYRDMDCSYMCRLLFIGLHSLVDELITLVVLHIPLISLTICVFRVHLAEFIIHQRSSTSMLMFFLCYDCKKLPCFPLLPLPSSPPFFPSLLPLPSSPPLLSFPFPPSSPSTRSYPSLPFTTSFPSPQSSPSFPTPWPPILISTSPFPTCGFHKTTFSSPKDEASTFNPMITFPRILTVVERKCLHLLVCNYVCPGKLLPIPFLTMHSYSSTFLPPLSCPLSIYTHVTTLSLLSMCWGDVYFLND